MIEFHQDIHMGHIFISYSHKDADYAHRFAETLQASGFGVWIDERLDYGSQWPLEIQKQLDACDAFIIIMTPRSFSSEWVQSELQRAKRKLKPILPLLLEGDEPWLSLESTQCYDVHAGIFPDIRFYSALKRVISVSQDDQTLRLSRRSVEPKVVVNSAILKFRITVAGVVGVATVFLAGLFVFLSLISNSTVIFSPAIAVAATSTMILQSSVTSEPTELTRLQAVPSAIAVLSTVTVYDLEPLLNNANIVLSTGTSEDIERVRGYFTGPKSAYQLLAIACLQVLKDRRVKQIEYLDMIDKWYTILVGENNYVSNEGMLNAEMLKKAMLKSHNEIYGDNLISFEQIVESKP
jgi:TIR domain-containing protein